MKQRQSKIHALFACDKPYAMTSHDCVSHLRRILHEKRVGHAGTLDPCATGVLVVGVGQATRLLPYLTSHNKSYIADIMFGYETSTEDVEGEITYCAEVSDKLFDPAFVTQVLQAHTGNLMQVPPSYSAISKDGVRSYDAARRGITLDLPSRQIYVYEACLLDISTQIDVKTQESYPVWRVAFKVSKGTYIRSLARDIGRYVSSAAHLSALRRVASGATTLEDTCTLDLFEHMDDDMLHAHMLNPLNAIDLQPYQISKAILQQMAYGQPIALDPSVGALLEKTQLVGCVMDNKLYGIYKLSGTTLMCEANFLDGIEGAVV